MKRTLLGIATVVGCGLLSALAWVGVTHATTLRAGESPSISSSETVDGSVYIAGNTVTVDGVIKGDVICAGMDVLVTATVEGDVICAGQMVRVTGKVLGDVRLAGQQVDITGDVQGSASVVGQTFALRAGSKVGRDLSLAADQVVLSGAVGRDVVGGATDVTVNGAIGRDLQVEMKHLTVGQGAAVTGNLTYKSPTAGTIAEGSIKGSTNYTPAPVEQEYNGAYAQIISTLIGFGALLLIGFAALAVSPRALDAVGATIRGRSLASFGFGATVFIAVPFVSILLMTTLVGIPLGIMALLVWIAALIGSVPLTAYAIGWLVIERLAWPSRGRRLASLIVGVIAIMLLGMIPIVGGIIMLLAIVFGLGGMVQVLFTHLRRGQARTGKAA